MITPKATSWLLHFRCKLGVISIPLIPRTIANLRHQKARRGWVPYLLGANRSFTTRGGFQLFFERISNPFLLYLSILISKEQRTYAITIYSVIPREGKAVLKTRSHPYMPKNKTRLEPIPASMKSQDTPPQLPNLALKTGDPSMVVEILEK